ncbi:biotin transport system permease protein [Flavimobilis soli]|uniref:Biotin transport system permease protein n=1 Tax=Flavimobilis soli TaxID=442709 RepID=A0A2A9EA04_9MICO|nr:energy-coupling factor transporter transmembrane protein EcfT [Flavimobilis soli]PFG35798.1 biotin transport system permease protein [Flavimobilis soli]
MSRRDDGRRPARSRPARLGTGAGAGTAAGAGAGASVLGLHVPGSSVVHRAPAGVKLAVLAVLGVLLAVGRSALLAAVVLVAVLALAAAARVGVGVLLRQARAVLVMLVALAAVQAWSVGVEASLATSLGLAATVLAAALLTATTRADALLDMLTAVLCRASRLPLVGRRVRPESVALAVALMLRAVPAVAQVERETRDAARARGLERSPRARLVPTVVRTVAMAHRTGEALAARGAGDGA